MPLQNRPRERFLKYGPETLSDAELFAEIKRVSYPFSILYWKDVEQYFGEPAVPVGRFLKN